MSEYVACDECGRTRLSSGSTDGGWFHLTAINYHSSEQYDRDFCSLKCLSVYALRGLETQPAQNLKLKELCNAAADAMALLDNMSVMADRGSPESIKYDQIASRISAALYAVEKP